MNISTLIKNLEDVKIKYGDLDIVLSNEEEGDFYKASNHPVVGFFDAFDFQAEDSFKDYIEWLKSDYDLENKYDKKEFDEAVAAIKINACYIN